MNFFRTYADSSAHRFASILSKNATYNISIIGIGGVGGYYGGKLALAYSGSAKTAINFVVRGEHLRKIKRDGLNLVTTTTNYNIHPTNVVENIHDLPIQDLIILATKSYHLNEELLTSLKRISHQHTYVLPLLNGVNARNSLEEYFSPHQIIDGCVYISSHLSEPGIVKQTGGSCELQFGSTYLSESELSKIQDVFIQAGISASISTNIKSVLWQKYLFVSPISSMLVAYGCDKNTILDNNELLDMLRKLMNEILIVAEKMNIIFSHDIIEQTVNKISRVASNTVPSMQLDYENGKPLEINIFSGYIVNQAKIFAIEVPCHQAIHELLKEKESILLTKHNVFKKP